MITIDPERWLAFLRDEYLDSFIAAGGTSIKFVVPLDEVLRDPSAQQLLRLARESRYIVAHISSGDTRIHMIDQLFFRVAEVVPWRELSQQVILKLAKQAGYSGPSDDHTGPVIQRLANANALDTDFLMMEARKWIQGSVFRQQSLTKDFRVAVTQLCLAELSGGPDGDTTIQDLSDWLTGRNPAVSAVKRYQIYSRISRSTARHFLESLLRWVRFAGLPGIAIILDISRVTIPRNPRDDLIYYTKAAMFDAYEVLRQFIDATDRMKGCLLVVLPDVEFLDIESAGRGLGSYDALKFRVYDEIHDQRLVNPMAALVRLSRSGSQL